MCAFLVLLLKLGGAAAAFALLFHFVPFDQVRAELGRADLLLVLLGVLVFLAGQVVAAARWRRILLSGGIEVPLSRALRMNLIGAFAGNFLPGMATGDLAKSALLFRDFPGRRSFLVASVVFDRLSGLAAIFILMVLGTALHGAASGDWDFAGYAVSAGALYALSLWLLATQSRLTGIFHVLPARLAAQLEIFANQLQGFFRTAGLPRWTLASGLIFQLSWVVSQWLMLSALIANAPFVPVMAASTFSLVVALLPVSLNGLGLREGAFSFLLQRFGVDTEIAVAVALLSLIPILVSSLIGGMFLTRMKSGRGAAVSNPVDEGRGL